MKDFDQFWGEKEHKPIDFKVFGKDEKLSPEMPASIVLQLMRAQKEYGNNVLPNIVYIEMAITIFTKEKLEEWAKKGLSTNQMIELVQWAMDEYTGNARAVQMVEKD
jgi:hypothetical protein